MRLPPAPVSIMELAQLSMQEDALLTNAMFLFGTQAYSHRPLLLCRVYICFKFSRRTHLSQKMKYGLLNCFQFCITGIYFSSASNNDCW